jgi:hypothetical protein
MKVPLPVRDGARTPAAFGGHPVGRRAARRAGLIRNPADLPDADLPVRVTHLYTCQGLSTYKIAGVVGIGFSREDRLSVPAEAIAALYVRSGLSARQVGEVFGVPHRIVLRAAHDVRLPVCVGGPPARTGPEEIELVEGRQLGQWTRGRGHEGRGRPWHGWQTWRGDQRWPAL